MKEKFGLFLVSFRCIPVYSDLRGYFSTINAYVIVSDWM